MGTYTPVSIRRARSSTSPRHHPLPALPVHQAPLPSPPPQRASRVPTPVLIRKARSPTPPGSSRNNTPEPDSDYEDSEDEPDMSFLQKFHRADSEDVEEFIGEIEVQAAAKQWDAQRQLRLIESLLRGPALQRYNQAKVIGGDIYRQEHTDHLQNADYPQRCVIHKNWLCIQFNGLECQQEAQEALTYMTQAVNETPKSFYHRLQAQMIKANLQPAVQLALASTTFLNGLYPELRRQVIRMGYRSIEQQVAGAQGCWEADYRPAQQVQVNCEPARAKAPRSQGTTAEQENAFLRAWLANYENRPPPLTQVQFSQQQQQQPPRVQEDPMTMLTKQMKDLAIAVAQLKNQEERQQDYCHDNRPDYRHQDNRSSSQAPSAATVGSATTGSYAPTCFYCGNQGHIQKNCPRKQATQSNDRNVNLIQMDEETREMEEEAAWFHGQDDTYLYYEAFPSKVTWEAAPAQTRG